MVIKAEVKKQLDQLYSLETVDAATVRTYKTMERREVKPVVASPLPELPLAIELGDEFRGWMESFLPEEPLQVLTLSAATERALLQAGKKQLKDLLSGGLSLGQGHLDEIAKKLQSYTEGRLFPQMVQFDLLAFIRASSFGTEPKGVAALFESFDLKGVIPLNPADRAALHTGKENLQLQGKKVLLEKKEEIISRFARVMRVYVFPWVERRGGIGTTREVEERLTRITLQPALVSPFLHLFSTLFDVRGEVISFHSDGDVVTNNQKTLDQYKLVLDIARSYFYQEDIAYPLTFLVQQILRETVRQWHEITPEFIVKALQYAPLFKITKNREHILQVSLA